MKKIKPLSDQVLIEALPEETKTASGIILPETAQEKPQQGKVVAVGPGRVTDDGKLVKVTDIKVGDVVLYKKWGGTEVKIDGKEYLLVAHNDILAIVG